MTSPAQIIKMAGGPAKVARLLNVSVQAACFWRDGKRQLPPEHCAPSAQQIAGTLLEAKPDPTLIEIRLQGGRVA